jgi:predicted glycogen debranching enzyme
MDNLIMTPEPGGRVVRFVGDRVHFSLSHQGGALPPGWKAYLRTNLGRGQKLREEIIHAHFQKVPLAGASWHDLPMRAEGPEWRLDLPLVEPGYFKAKAYARDERGWQVWPAGPDLGISVHPDHARTGNTLYCAFTRLYGQSRDLSLVRTPDKESALEPWDKQGYTIIPPSGKLRDLTAQAPHIFKDLGCQILHLLPINPAPTTYARFGRYGSPYACQDLTAIDLALVDFDRRTNSVDQFRELTHATHCHGGRLFLDLVINHTGWGATLLETHPEWYKRTRNGEFESPGAWGNIWADLVELNQRHPGLWEQFAEAFLTWCRRGVDGFRCDAGYMVPTHVWQYIVARVQAEFPNTVFLLEGLGGAWSATEALLTEGRMQWAYSELFQNYSGAEVSTYLDHSVRQSDRCGLLVHYSETHDNLRLAAKGRAWALLRNQLCALTSTAGGFGFTGGVEWLADEKINVHNNAGLRWGAAENLVPELARLNDLLTNHPCFFAGARLARLSPESHPVYALGRESEEGRDQVLVLVNLDAEHEQAFDLSDHPVVPLTQVAPRQTIGAWARAQRWVDLLTQATIETRPDPAGRYRLTLAPGQALCLATTSRPHGLAGDAYRRARAQAAFGLEALAAHLPAERIGNYDWRWLAAEVEADPVEFLRLAAQSATAEPARDLQSQLTAWKAHAGYAPVITWQPSDQSRVLLVPPGHWLLVRETVPFRVTLTGPGQSRQHREAIRVHDGYVAAFPAPAATGAEPGADAQLTLERLVAGPVTELGGTVRYLRRESTLGWQAARGELVLLTNGRGGMARLAVDLGSVKSKYDCVLGANLHTGLPVDRHVFIKRVRAWLDANGFITPLNGDNLVEFVPGPPAVWRFAANAGDGQSVEIELTARMIPGQNTVLLHWHRPARPPAIGRDLPTESAVRLTVRLDVEDRNFHWETHRNEGAEHHFTSHTQALRFPRPEPEAKPPAGQPACGFEFTPAADRQLRVVADHGHYHHQPEWSLNLPHPVEQSRGQPESGDGFSPGWFDLPLAKGETATIAASAEMEAWTTALANPRPAPTAVSPAKAELILDRLHRAVQDFVVQRGVGKTVIAGYPWFLDWGRDTLICARGLIAAGQAAQVREILITFARFEEEGTLPNTIHGEDASNRDTSDAPLWFGMVCEDLAATQANEADRWQLYHTIVDATGRTLQDVLRSIAEGYRRGTRNGIRMDPDSGLVYSPSHFTWMDTNYPAGTPRAGYPVEIQALWIRLLRQLEHLDTPSSGEGWGALARRAEAAFHRLFWLPEKGWLADVLLAYPGQPAQTATPDQALRSNQLLAVCLGLVRGTHARQCVQAAERHLVVPGALRSLAPLPVTPPLPIHGAQGQLLNDPQAPYWGRYEGDEDTRRKPAYHNGTAWTWTFPHFCEALAVAWEECPTATAAAAGYLGSIDQLLMSGCLGHLPEIVDGDQPHQQRGCDAQAWGVTEALRVWLKLAKSGAREASPQDGLQEG